MSSSALENCLARLYCDAQALQNFLRDPEGESQRLGLTSQERVHLLQMNRADLSLAAKSFALKRAGRNQGKTLLQRLFRRWYS